MRLFIAVDPPEDVLDEVQAAVAGVRRNGDGLRWSGRRDWHITLHFLGEVGERRRPGLEAAFAAEAARHGAPHIAVRGAGTFPGDDTRAVVLWAGVEGGTAALGRLAGGLRRTARRCGERVERRPYVPHLTLARSRTPVDLADTRTALAGLATPFWHVEEIHLMESRPGAGEDRYRTVATWPLGPNWPGLHTRPRHSATPGSTSP
ncbi:RNA 2',3'-cyclic phosphodiesterase [Nocardiopsis composta]|uniref:RNA 2',3'-cyclic phosphodiesterase n=1 Tax=Nocardiopsis composta TaxID=157465 RepID=A0A7W8QPJ3_9ACTN|nr:RNA 2',3'-cyclic phosphodiesterase [Nocardiopsis composta]MBB5434242.1 2'-5' RNA ligase [Nocardiopsis composta]